MVDCGSTPVFIVLVAMIFPIYLVILTTQYGCIYNTPYGCDYDGNPINSSDDIVVYIGSSAFKPASFATLMIAISGAMQCIAYLFISSIADYNNYQHYLYPVFMTSASLMMIACVFFNKPEQYVIFGIWGAALLVPFGLGQILYNAYLPLLVENHWSMRRLLRGNNDAENMEKNSYQRQQKKLLQTVQDDVSQFGTCVGYIGGLIATIISAVILFLAIDNTTEITDNYGIMSSNDYVTIYEHKQELWMKKVVGVNIWYSFVHTIVGNESSEIGTYNESFVNGIQFIYEDNLNGSIHGSITSHDLSQVWVDDSNQYDISTRSMHSYFNIDSNDFINQLILFQSNQTQIIHALKMITRNDNVFEIGHIDNSSYYDPIFIKSDNFPMDTLCGYTTASGNYSIFSVATLQIISGYTFAFMDEVQGQYGNNYDNLGVYVFIGIWSLVCSIPSFCILKKRKKPPIPETSSVFTVSIKSYWHTLKTATSYPNLFKTLIAWFVWSGKYTVYYYPLICGNTKDIKCESNM